MMICGNQGQMSENEELVVFSKDEKKMVFFCC